jgi:hypothetical protein
MQTIQQLPCRRKLTTQEYSEAKAAFVSVVAESLLHYQEKDPESGAVTTDEEIVTALKNLKDGRPLIVLSGEYQLAFSREFTPLDKKYDWLTWIAVSFFTVAGDSVDFTDALVESLLQGLDLDGPNQTLNSAIPGWRMFGMAAMVDELRKWVGIQRPAETSADPKDVFRIVLRNNKHLIINLLAIISRYQLTEITNGVTQ